MAFDKETLDLLTDEERAALEEDIEEMEDGQEEGEEDQGGEGMEDAEQESEEVAEEESGEPGESSPAAPVLIANAPDDLDSQLAALAENKSALVDQFDNGELTAREYQQQLDALAKQEREIERVQFKAQLADDMRRQSEANAWASEVNTFIGEHKVYSGNEYAWNALDQAVRKIANNPDNSALSGRQILDKAHAELSQAFGWEEKPAESAKPEARQKIKHAAPPPTLSKMPAAEINDTDGNRFAALDRLMDSDPLGYEAALGKMSKADRDAYLASA